MLYLTTNMPDKLLAYNTKTRAVEKEISLNRAPNCLSISEDGHKALIGHTWMISLIDMDNFSVNKTLDSDYNIYDIEWGTGDWCCYTPGSEVSHYDLHWLNINTGEQYVTNSSGLYGETIIKKIPHQNYIIASRLIISPSGISVFDNNTKALDNYFHEDAGKFWYSSTGEYLFGSYSHVYKTSALLTQSDVSFVYLDPPVSGGIEWIDHDAATNSLWVLQSYYYYDQHYEIWKYETTDFKRVGTCYYDDSYVTIVNGNSVTYPVQAHYVFANGQGTELIVLRNTTNDTNIWSIEFVGINL